jgi:hypothetical protein
LVITPPTAALSPLPILSRFAVYHGSQLEPMNHPEEALEAQQVEAARPPIPWRRPLLEAWQLHWNQVLRP